MTDGDTPARHSRQAAILPPEKLNTIDVGVVGVGAIGRQVALQLAAAGQIHITIYDHDTVEEVNLGPQGFLVSDLGTPKVVAVGNLMRAMNPDLRLTQHQRRFNIADRHTVLFSCVDTIEVREHIWRNVGINCDLFVDGRMSAEVARIITACDKPSRDYYPSTLFSDGEAFQGACTARSTIFTSNIAAGLMVEEYSKWLREMPTDRDVLFNLLAMEISHL